MAPHSDSPPPTPNSFSKPKPRPPKSPAQVALIRVRNRRLEYLERNPEYFRSAEHEFADPLLYDSLIRSFHTPAEREAEGREKGYSRTLESSLLRGEARLARLAATAADTDDANGSMPGNEVHDNAGSQPFSPDDLDPGLPSSLPVLSNQEQASGLDLDLDPKTSLPLAPPTTREEGRQRWEEFLRERFVCGGDEEFVYRVVDEDDGLDVLERKDEEEAWFDDEAPDWASGGEDGEGDGGDGGRQPERILHGETGVQDF